MSSGFLFLGIQTIWAKYPEKQITVIMCWAAGGSVDLSFRPLATAASRILGQQLAIEIRPGASGGVGMGVLKTRKPDGYHLGVTSISTLIHQNMNKVTYDLLKDFAPILQFADAPYGLAVLTDAPWKTFKDFMDYAKSNPGKIRFSSSGPGDPGGFLTMSSLGNRLSVHWNHIPFEGGPPALAAILGGHVEAYAASLGVVKPQILAGRLRLLATFGEKRQAAFPNVPTLKEMGIPIVAPSFNGVFAPVGITGEVQETLHQAFKKSMEDPDFMKALELTDKTSVYRGPQDAAAHFFEVDQEIKRVIREMKLRKG